MLFDMERMEAQSRYKILTSTVTPRPIAWVTTLSEDGVINAAPYSFFNVLGHEPPTSPHKKTGPTVAGPVELLKRGAD
jgi:flavin reductase (DIM6/NTAB) family NADH-FMN oxidoreductase RutF